MKKRISKKQMFFNKINLTADDQLYIGIDVHKKSYHLAFWLNDAPAIDFVMPANNKKVLQFLQKVRIAIKQIVYEAGPTGYSLEHE
jgi:transposase